MKISLVTNETCQFSGKQEKFLINLVNEEGHSINISREFLEIGLRILNAVDVPVNQPPSYPLHREASPQPPCDVAGVSVQQPQQGFTVNGPQPPRFTPRTPPPSTVDVNKVTVFLKEVEKQQKKYASENDDKKQDGISNIAIQNAIKEKHREINKETMAKALVKTIPGMTQELFEMTYERSVRDYDKNFVDED